VADVDLAANLYVEVYGFVPAQAAGVGVDGLKAQVLDVAGDGGFADKLELIGGYCTTFVDVVVRLNLYVKRSGMRIEDLD
jgi:hypothetical protein